MIHYKSGNIFEENVDAIVNTVNCVGVMGRGIALQFKNRFPQNFKAYAEACKSNSVKPGKMFIYEPFELTEPKFIVNFPTKRHWRGKSRIEDIELGLQDLVQQVLNRNIKSLAIPPLGSGLGGLNWPDVKKLIECAFKDHSDLEVIVFEPNGAPDIKNLAKCIDIPDMSPGRASLVTLMQRYVDGLMSPYITLLEVHKLMYFMQVAGEPLRLKYKQAQYGPYAENLRHVLRKIEGHFVSGYADGGDEPTKKLHLVPGAIEEASSFLLNQAQTNDRLGKVKDLVDGFESPFGLELLATVHWVTSQKPNSDIDGVISAVYSWNERKKQFTERQIRLAYSVLNKKGWLV